jgi:hypothetical protein
MPERKVALRAERNQNRKVAAMVERLKLNAEPCTH